MILYFNSATVFVWDHETVCMDILSCVLTEKERKKERERERCDNTLYVVILKSKSL